MTSEKCAVVYVNSSESDLRRKACARWRQCLTGLVVLTSLSTAVICLGVCMFTLQAVSDLESRLGHAESIVAQERDQLTTLQAQAVSMKLQAPHVREGHGRSKRHSRARRNRRGRRRRNSRHGHTPTFVHLVGTNTTSDAALFTGGKFQWNLFHPDDAPLPGLGLETNNNPVTIRIDVNGIFDVYSQIGIEGRNDNTGNNHVACGHKTVLIRRDQTRTLMESRVTQHNLGDAYSHSLNRPRYAFDTLVHRGTFKLQTGDKLSVRRRDNCQHFRFRSNPTFAYFGVVERYRS